MASGKPSSELLAEEHRLIDAAQQGDRSAFAALVERYWERIYRWLHRLTRDSHTAEDLAQETFLKALVGLRKFQLGSHFGAWLYRIAHNNFANHYRAARKREPLPVDLADREPGPAEQAQTAEALQGLTQALHRLPADFRAALLLRVEEGLSFREIADVLNLTEETARWRVFKARQKLLRVLTPRLEQEKP